MWGIDDPTAPHAPATNLPDARLNVLHVTIWYVIQLILWTKHTLAFIKKEKTRKKKLSVHTVNSFVIHTSVRLFGSRSRPTSCRSWPGPNYLQTTKVTAGKTIRTVWSASILSLTSQNCLSNLFASRSGSTRCRSWSWFKLFA